MPKDKSFSFLPRFLHTRKFHFAAYAKKIMFEPQNHINSFTFDIGLNNIQRTKWQYGFTVSFTRNEKLNDIIKFSVISFLEFILLQSSS